MDRTVGLGNCSITVHLKQTKQVSGGGVLLEACRVGSVNEADGSIVLNWDMGELGRARPSVSAEEMTRNLSAFLFSDIEDPSDPDVNILSESRVRKGLTTEEGICRFEELEEGAWLIHAIDSTSYGSVEDALVSVPYYEEKAGEWTGPVYEQDVWLKAAVTQKEEEIPPSPTPQIPETSEQEKPGTVTQTTQTEKKRKKEVSSPGGTTVRTPSGSTQPVKTLDDTPLSGMIFLFLMSGLFLSMLLNYLKKKRRGSRIRNRRIRSSLIILIFGAGMLAAPFRSAYAAEPETGLSGLDEENRIVFVNEASDIPGLTVSKEVLDAVNGSRAPGGDHFTFRLKVDQKRASGVKYRLFDERGIELVPSQDGESLIEIDRFEGISAALRTGIDGTFSITAGQTALFEDISPGQLWEVSELEQENYERVVPAAGDTISKTMESTGGQAHFVNRFLPPHEEGDGQGELEITKRILWPEGIPLPSSGEFRIRVTVDGAPWSGAIVERMNLYDEGIVEDAITDENGCFVINGNQKALLRDMPMEADVLIEELEEEEDLFVPSGETVWKGAVASRQKILFTNRLASFVVTKTLTKGESDRSFTFTLTQNENLPVSGAAYYLVEEDGQSVSREPEYTNEKGQFQLCAGQRAVFAGLREGTKFHVREEKAFGYRQITPSDYAGYRNLSIGNGMMTLIFENEASSVRLFAPSAGGVGIGLFIVISVTGMIILSLLLIRRRRRI